MPPLIGITASIDHRGSAYGEVYFITRRYVDAIQQAGGVPLIVPHNLNEASLRLVFEKLDGVLLSGGGDIDPAIYGEEIHPATCDIEADRDRVELALARWVVEKEKPFLAICRGIQVLNVALGGSLVQDIPAQMPDALEHSFDRDVVPREFNAHPVKVAPGSHLERLLQMDVAQVNSWHHQAIRRAGARLQITALAPDGVIEAVEVPGHRFGIGVQWHPEWLFTRQPEMMRLFAGLVQAASTNGQRIHE